MQKVVIRSFNTPTKIVVLNNSVENIFQGIDNEELSEEIKRFINEFNFIGYLNDDYESLVIKLNDKPVLLETTGYFSVLTIDEFNSIETFINSYVEDDTSYVILEDFVGDLSVSINYEDDDKVERSVGLLDNDDYLLLRVTGDKVEDLFLYPVLNIDGSYDSNYLYVVTKDGAIETV